jgi:hypothetical protein
VRTERATAASLTAGRLTLLRLARRAGSLHVEAAESFALPDGAEARSDLRRRVAEQGFAAAPVVLVMPSHRTYCRVHRPAVATERALRRTIRYELEPDLPVPPDTLAFDYVPAGGGKDGRVLFVGCPADEVRAAIGALRTLDLEPLVVTTGAAGLASACSTLGVTGRALCLHFGRDAVDVLHLEDGALCDARAFPVDGQPREDVLPPAARAAVVAAAASGGLDAVLLSGTDGWAEAASPAVEQESGLRPRRLSIPEAALAGLPPQARAVAAAEGLPLFGAAAELLGADGSPGLNLMLPRLAARVGAVHLRLPMRAAAVALALLLVVWTAAGFVHARRADRELRASRGALAVLWDRYHPGQALPPEPARVLRGELAVYAGRDGPQGAPRSAALDVLRRIASAAPEGLGDVPYSRVHIAPDGCTAEGSAPDYAAVAALVHALERDGGFAVGSPEMQRQAGAVSFRLELAGGGP